MSVKKLFAVSKKVLPATSIDNVAETIESVEQIQAVATEQARYVPRIDFSNLSNFVHYGSAEKYYQDAFAYIARTYPYDGSLAERQQWHNSASYFDNYVYDNLYPKAVGCAVFSPQGYGVLLGSSSLGIWEPQDQEYISVQGGPHADEEAASISKAFPEPYAGKANYLDTASGRSSNLSWNGDDGATVEFWLKRHTSGSSCGVETVIDLWNGFASGSVSYGRLLVAYLDRGLPGQQYVYPIVCSGSFVGGVPTTGYATFFSGVTSLASDVWHHYAVVFQNNGTDFDCTLYVDGTLIATQTNVGAGGMATVLGNQGLSANVGALRTAWPEDDSDTGWGKVSGSLDEVRFWKTARSSADIGRHWFEHVGGGSNTDDANVALGLYYKFNEGIFTSASTVDAHDETVLDYSGRISNGTWRGYVSGSRSPLSAINESGFFDVDEEQDPIIYTVHSEYIDTLDLYATSGSAYDTINNAALWKLVPAWITEEDEATNGILQNLVQIMASYLDQLHQMIHDIPSIQDTTYVQEGYKPNFFARRLLEGAGLRTPELFSEASILESVAKQSDIQRFSTKLIDVKNLIYQNLYNNLTYLYKAKGTEKALRNALRCFGIDEDLVKVNLYAHNATYKLQDRTVSVARKKKYLSTAAENRLGGSVFQSSGSAILAADESTFLPAVSGSGWYENGVATLEVNVQFPVKPETESIFYYDTPFVSASIVGFHAALSSSQSDYTWASPDPAVVLYVVRPSAESTDAFFALSSSAGEITSSLYPGVYDGQRWQFAIRYAPINYENYINRITGSTVVRQWELYGVYTTLDLTEQEFTISGSAGVQNLFATPIRVFAGAHRQNFTGSIIDYSDSNITNVRFWYDYLQNEEIKFHSQDVYSLGRKHPNSNAYFAVPQLDGISIPAEESLALNWSFDLVTGSNADGRFAVLDLSSGSLEQIDAARYRFLSGALGNKHPGQGWGFAANDDQVVDLLYVPSAKLQLPGAACSSDMVAILEEDDEIFTRASAPINYFFAAEKSMSQCVSEDMLKLFATIADFNNLIGEPVHRYRLTYKSLEKLRQLYFNHITNISSFERFVDFYKWIDSAISDVLYQLVPASADVSDSLRTMVESHILERNKIRTQFPTLEMKEKPLVGRLRGVNEMLYSWLSGHAPVSSAEATSRCIWWQERAERDLTSAIASSDPLVDAQRENIRLVCEQLPDLSDAPEQYDPVTPQRYEQNTYANRQLANVARLSVTRGSVTVLAKEPEGFNKNLDFIYDTLPRDHGIGSEALRVVPVLSDLTGGVNASEARRHLICLRERDASRGYGSVDDVGSRIYKTKLRGWYLQHSGSAEMYRGNIVAPFSMFYHYNTSDNPDARLAGYVLLLTNQHVDSYGSWIDAPVQGPFTEAHVGGRAHRHTSLNEGADTINERLEGYRIAAEGAYFVLRPPVRGMSYAREGLTKRPINIANISSSLDSKILGNYRFPWEVLHTVGRRHNNGWLVDLTGSLPPFNLFPLYGNPDFSLPERGRHACIFAERFSAPGDKETMSRGYLDRASEEYSPYNAMPWRNRVVRQALNDWSSIYCLQGGYNSVLGASYANWHKVNRNPQYRYENISGSYVCMPSYDNLFVQHALPQRDLQYSWITASYLDYPCMISIPRDGYISGSSGYVPAITFASSSEYYDANGRFNFVGAKLGASIGLIDSVDIDTNTVSGTIAAASTVPQAAKLYGFNLLRNGPYEHPTWKQIRAGEHAVSRKHKENNIISVEDEASTTKYSGYFYNPDVVATGLYKQVVFKDMRGDGHTNFIEPCVAWGRPVSFVLNDGTDTKNQYLYASLENDVAFFANIELNNKLDLFQSEGGAYEEVSALYLDAASTHQFKGLVYCEGVFPKAVNVGLARTRTRINYDEEAGIGVGEFDQDVLHRRKIWDSSCAKRARSYVYSDAANSGRNCLGQHDRRNSVWPLDDFSGSISGTMLVGCGIGGELHNLITTAMTSSISKFGEFSYLDMVQLNQSYPATASVLFCNPERIAISGALEYGMRPWTAESESNLTPWYYNYNAFTADIRPQSQKMSIVPEFRISEHMERYVIDQGGNFRGASNPAILSVDGGDPSSSAVGNAVPDEDFYAHYAHSDVAEQFTRIFEDHKDLAVGEEIVLKCNVLKKLLPYNGFYPVHRTLQLANLFSQSYADNIVSDTPGSDPMPRRLQALMQPFFAPGIMYNTIKSGIAVDWAAQTGSAAASAGAVGDSLAYACCFTNDAASGNDDFLTISSGSWNFNYANADFSACAWVRTTDTNGVIWSHGMLDNWTCFAWAIFLFEGQPLIWLGGNTPAVEAKCIYLKDMMINDNTWHLVGFTWRDGAVDGILKIFVDGNVYTAASRPWTIFVNNSLAHINNPAHARVCFATVDLSVAGPADTSTFAFDGLIGDSAFYNAALSNADIATIYGYGHLKPPLNQPGAPAGLTHWYRMGEEPGDDLTTIYDAVAAADATVSGDTKIVAVGALTASCGFLTEEPNFRIPFEALIDPESYVPISSSQHNNSIYLLAPSWQLIDDGASYVPSFTWNGMHSNVLYGMAAHNFFGELPKFFLRDGTLNVFSSAKQAEFKALVSGTTYYMDIALYKTPEYFMVRSPYGSASYAAGYPAATGSFYTSASLGWITSSYELEYHGRYFGPAILPVSAAFCHGALLSGSLTSSGGASYSPEQLVADPAYAAYTPPYYYGKAIARCSFFANESRKFSLDEIHGGMQIEDLNEQLADAIERIDEVRPSASSGNILWDSAMHLDASVQLKGKQRQFKAAWTAQQMALASLPWAKDQDLAPQTVSDESSDEMDAWVIYPRCECPTLHFADVTLDDPHRGPYGMWSNYGTPLQGSEGIYLALEESFKERTSANQPVYPNTGSLLDVCGFKKGVKRIGEVAASKVIEEAVIAIPFRDNPSPDGFASTFQLGTRHVFALDAGELTDQKKKMYAVGASVSDIHYTSIMHMLAAMPKYYLPPEFDFLTYTEDKPFVMYIFEFAHTLDCADLCRIWQGLMPKLAYTTYKDATEIRHGMGVHEFFGGLPIPNDVRWLIFKVKRKAEKSYYSSTADSRDDEKFKFSFKGSKKAPEYSYNWPYDYFSMLEYASFDVGLEYAASIVKDKKVPNVQLIEQLLVSPEATKTVVEASTVDIGNISGWLAMNGGKRQGAFTGVTGVETNLVTNALLSPVKVSPQNSIMVPAFLPVNYNPGSKMTSMTWGMFKNKNADGNTSNKLKQGKMF
jgi:hypothetical protein